MNYYEFTWEIPGSAWNLDILERSLRTMATESGARLRAVPHGFIGRGLMQVERHARFIRILQPDHGAVGEPAPQIAAVIARWQQEQNIAKPIALPFALWTDRVSDEEVDIPDVGSGGCFLLRGGEITTFTVQQWIDQQLQAEG